jgi:hypothetical protein
MSNAILERTRPARETAPTWISQGDAAEILVVNRMQVERIAVEFNVRRRVLPGVRTKYYREDIERVARECVVGSAK